VKDKASPLSLLVSPVFKKIIYSSSSSSTSSLLTPSSLRRLLPPQARFENPTPQGSRPLSGFVTGILNTPILAVQPVQGQVGAQGQTADTTQRAVNGGTSNWISSQAQTQAGNGIALAASQQFANGGAATSSASQAQAAPATYFSCWIRCSSST
jgi:hypothetical protein